MYTQIFRRIFNIVHYELSLCHLFVKLSKSQMILFLKYWVKTKMIIVGNIIFQDKYKIQKKLKLLIIVIFTRFGTNLVFLHGTPCTFLRQSWISASKIWKIYIYVRIFNSRPWIDLLSCSELLSNLFIWLYTNVMSVFYYNLSYGQTWNVKLLQISIICIEFKILLPQLVLYIKMII